MRRGRASGGVPTGERVARASEESRQKAKPQTGAEGGRRRKEGGAAASQKAKGEVQKARRRAGAEAGLPIGLADWRAARDRHLFVTRTTLGNANHGAEAKSRGVHICNGVSGLESVRILHVQSQTRCSGAATAIGLAPATEPTERTVYMLTHLISIRTLGAVLHGDLSYYLRYIGWYIAR